METMGEDKRIWETTALKGRSEGRGSIKAIKNVQAFTRVREKNATFLGLSFLI